MAYVPPMVHPQLPVSGHAAAVGHAAVGHVAVGHAAAAWAGWPSERGYAAGAPWKTLGAEEVGLESRD